MKKKLKLFIVYVKQHGRLNGTIHRTTENLFTRRLSVQHVRQFVPYLHNFETWSRENWVNNVYLHARSAKPDTVHCAGRVQQRRQQQHQRIDSRSAATTAKSYTREARNRRLCTVQARCSSGGSSNNGSTAEQQQL